jgi:mono/diheme cytochrome c family protein
MVAARRSFAGTGLRRAAILVALSWAVGGWADNHHDEEDDDCDGNDHGNARAIQAEVIATGIPGAGAIAQIGTFHKGSPFRDNAVFAGSTDAGQILSGDRLFVASSSNFGAPLAIADQYEGSILSLDVSSGPVAVPATFATAGNQASAAGGKVRLYAAQSPAFLNSINNPGAATAGLTSVSLPLGISFNNGFGRPWFANAPKGAAADGTITVIDPAGAPFAGPPSPVAGGVFAGSVTNRNAASTHGLTAGALATALITKSPDGSNRAVFFAALADGSVVQVHVQKGVDGLAVPGTFTPVSNITPASAESNSANVAVRAGMVFNWVPNRAIYITDASANRVVALDLTDDGTLFTTGAPRYFYSRWINRPIDIAAATPEVASRSFASNTTLGGGSDLYVLNRGNNTIVRMSQEGKVMAVRRIDAAVPGFRANGLVVSDDARTLYVTATTAGRGGVVLKMPAFGLGLITPQLIAHAVSNASKGAITQGADIFSNELTPFQGLGPLFNARSCNACHGAPTPGGMGTTPDSFDLKVARIDSQGNFHALSSRARSISEFGFPCGLPTGVPPQANVVSNRSAMTLRGTSLIENISDAVILANAAAAPVGVRGRANLIGGRVGRFGWKAQIPTLVEFMGDAFRSEMGVTNPLAPEDLVHGCGASILKPEADAVALTSVVAFLNTVDPPAPTAACLASAGAPIFTATGCASCHTPSLPGPGNNVAVRLYSDLVLHDMGPGLADGIVDSVATGSEFRTMPLWRTADRAHFLHDGRASTVSDAISAHGGQAAAAAANYQALSATDRQALLDFLSCL